jgi:predicted ATPase/DNA-binding SARP family transcriptional activator
LNQSGKLKLFGLPCWISANGTTVIPQGQFLWLLAYVATQDDWVSRKDLAELLWDDVDLAGGLNNLRQLLHRNKNLEWAGMLEASSQALRLTGNTDIKIFRRACQAANWQTALQEYSGSMLEGLRPHGLEQLESFFESERSILQSDWREALIGRTQTLERQGNSVELFELLQRLLEADPYNEDALHSYLKQALKLGQLEKGALAFRAFRQRLKADLGLLPLPDTLRLAEQVSGSELVARGSDASDARLMGRETEKALIQSQLESDSVRLLTLRGSGGVGKTTLATWVLETGKNWFQDGTVWVALQPVSTLDDVPLVIAAALKLTLDANAPVWNQISEHLRHQNLLLILDNIEHLRGVSESLAGLLEVATKLKLLVTSRVSLELPAETLMVLEGLDYPEAPNLELAQSSSAVRLFVERAARRRAGFVLTAQTMPGILRICAAVHGLPLGLELAAAWAGELSPDALADGLESNADLPELESDGKHRSLQTVFDHSWELLEDELRHALSALSVFRGGFERRAALEGMNISARALLGLVGRSLLQSLPGGRYDLHSVVQTFAAQKLEDEQLRHLQLEHARYFARFAEQAEAPLRGGAAQTRWLERLAADHRNFTAVLETCHEIAPDLALRTATALSRYWMLHGRAVEGLGQLEAAINTYKISAHSEVSEPTLLARAQLAAGIQASCSALFERAYAHLDAAQLETSAHGLVLIEAEVLYWRAANERDQGLLEMARVHLNQAMSLQEREHDLWGLGHSINDLGVVCAMEGDDDTAESHFQTSLRLCREREDRKGEASALENIALVSPHRLAAITLMQESLAIKRELGDIAGIAVSLSNLGNESLQNGKLQEARDNILESMELFYRIGQPLKTVHNLSVLGEISVLEDKFTDALTLYGASLAGFERLQALPDDRLSENIRWLEAKAREALTPEVADAAYALGRSMTLDEAVCFARQGGVIQQDRLEAEARVAIGSASLLDVEN